MKAMVTGDKGFVGKHLAQALRARGDEVMGYDIKNGYDILDAGRIRTKILEFEPEEIYHLAAQANVPNSIKFPQTTLTTNVIGTVNLLEAVKGTKTKVLLASTGHALTNSSPYTVSKLAMEYMGQYYSQNEGVALVITRAHNHAGPGQSDEYAVSSFAKQVALIEKGEQDKISHGNLDSVRNYTDVRDIVKAYMIAITQKPGVYEIASENNLSMNEIVGVLLDKTKTKIKLVLDPKKYRKGTSFEATNNLPGWTAEIPLEQTMEDTLNYWRNK